MINLGGARGPIWRRVLAHLRQRIEAGEFPDLLPSERTLTEEYGVSKGTIRKALAELRMEGVIRTDKGWGSYVVEPPEER
jgi:GntR family transcriptional regulator